MLRKHIYLRLAANAVQYRVPMIVRQVYLDNDGYFNSLCPRCHRTVPWEYMAFCSGCGQCLSWIFLDEAEELSPPIDPQRSPSKFGLSFLFRVAIQRLKSRHRTSIGADRKPSSAQDDSDDMNTAHEEAEEDEWIRVNRTKNENTSKDTIHRKKNTLHIRLLAFKSQQYRVSLSHNIGTH